ncbi:YihY/virulence factor BrkB family protein [Azospirillum sp. ST 5-10]|uniref:YihY/virulence factor BrkB family protein n=1 Tax=unclassified Azospirillum TaxID=2630922 RepID=UPI003F49F2C3
MDVIGTIRQVLVGAVQGWVAHNAMSMGASIAFYTVFSLTPLVVLVTATAGAVFGDEAAQGALYGQLSEMVDPEVARAIQGLVASAGTTQAGLLAGGLSIVTLLVGATTVLAELQAALDRIWEVAPSQESTLSWIVRVRLKGLALVAAFGFLLIASLFVSAALSAFGTWIKGQVSALATLAWGLDSLSSWIAFTLMFALIYRILPNARISWLDIWLGAAVTALLFLVGKLLIGLYLGTSGIASAYGAAGSFVLILIWVYYSSTIFLFGAEITRAYSEHAGSRSAR